MFVLKIFFVHSVYGENSVRISLTSVIYYFYSCCQQRTFIVEHREVLSEMLNGFVEYVMERNSYCGKIVRNGFSDPLDSSEDDEI